jgi:molybdopterin/thiamine biosynthesis adenylyltransferase
VEPWFERWPELLEWELARFRAHQFPAEIDEAARLQGWLVIRSEVSFRGEKVSIEARYPAETPELPPSIHGPTGLLERHQNPMEGNFCLLEDPLDSWPAREWGAADLIAERLLKLLSDSEAGADVVAANEAPLPEPVTAFFPVQLGPVVLIPEECAKPPAGTHAGTLRARLFDPGALRFYVDRLDGSETTRVISAVLGLGQAVHGKWLRLTEPPPIGDAETVVAWLRNHHPDLVPRALPPKLRHSSRLPQPDYSLVGLHFPEEGPAVGETSDAWLFVCFNRAQQPFLIHSQLFSREQRQRRIPSLLPLGEKRVAVIGLGTLGGALALELAKGGVGRLDLVDFDRFEVSNTVRHVLGVEFSGLPKTTGIEIACNRANPFGQVEAHQMQIGSPVQRATPPVEALRKLIGENDLVVETTGSHQVQRLIARLSAEEEKPFVSCWLTNGFLGGALMRIVPGRTGCFVCSATDLAEGRLAAPEAGSDEAVVAQACSHPTVSGAGFDASELVAMATRLVAQTLGASPSDADWDYGAISFYRSPIDDSHPRLVVERLAPKDDCEACARAAG